MFAYPPDPFPHLPAADYRRATRSSTEDSGRTSGPISSFPHFPAAGYRRATRRSTDDSGRTSSPISSLSTENTSTNGRKRANAWDTSTTIGSTSAEANSCDRWQIRSRSNSPPDFVSVARLDRSTTEFSHRLRSLIGSVDLFCHLANRGTNASDDLLHELNRKIKPRILNLDEDLSLIVDEIKFSIDRCTISDNRLSYLLTYNGFLQEIHNLLEKMMVKILDVLERHLTTLDRGAVDAPNRNHQVHRTVRQISEAANRLELNLLDEAARRRQSSNSKNRGGKSF